MPYIAITIVFSIFYNSVIVNLIFSAPKIINYFLFYNSNILLFPFIWAQNNAFHLFYNLIQNNSSTEKYMKIINSYFSEA